MQQQSIFTSIRLAIIVALGGFLYGFDASVISGVVGFVTTEFQLNVWEQGFVVSAPSLAALFASPLMGNLADAVGRKKVLIAISALYVVSAILSAIAPDFWTLVIARCLGGFAFASLIIAPIYIGEVAPSNQRGRLVSINQLNIVVGLSAAYFANYAFLQVSQDTTSWLYSMGANENVWRWMLGIETIPALISLILLFSIPESPRWLVMKQRYDEALAVLTKLVPGRDNQALLEEIKRHNGDEKQPPLSERIGIMLSPRLRLTMFIALVIAIAQMGTGINAVFFYAPTVFAQSGIGTDAAFAQSVLVGLINIVGTLVAMALIDKLGRKPLLSIGLVGVVISMSLCAYGFYTATYTLTAESVAAIEGFDTSRVEALIGQTFTSDVAFKNALISTLGDTVANQYQDGLLQAAANMNPVLLLAGILGFVASFSISLGPVMWVLFSEIFPNNIRGLAISSVGIFNALTSTVVTQMFPWQLANLGAAITFLIYGLVAIIALILVAWLLPETRGKSLEELEDILQDGSNEKRGNTAT